MLLFKVEISNRKIFFYKSLLDFKDVFNNFGFNFRLQKFTLFEYKFKIVPKYL